MVSRKIVIWHEMDGVGDESLRHIEMICCELYKNEGVKCELVQMNILEFTEKLDHLATISEKPDIIFIPQDMVMLENADLSEVPDKYSRFMSGLIWDSMKYKGIQRGIPYLQGNHAVMYYNRKYVKKGFTTWNEIIKLNIKNVVNISFDLEVAYWIMPFIYTMYGNPINKGCVTVTVDNAENIITFIMDLLNSKTLSSYCATSTMLEKFIAGEIACMINGEWLYGYLKNVMGEEVGICILPKIEDSEMIGLSSSVGISFPNNSLLSDKRMDLELFIEYMLCEKVQERWFTQYKRFPINKNVLKKIQYNEWGEDFNLSYEQMKNNVFIVNEESLNELWVRGKEILNAIQNRFMI